MHLKKKYFGGIMKKPEKENKNESDKALYYHYKT